MDLDRETNEEIGCSNTNNIVESDNLQDDHALSSNSNVEQSSSSLSPPAPSFWSNPAQLTAMISNFSTSYNVVNISLVLPILEMLHPDATEEDISACASALLAGMMVGQLLGGALGDSFLGRLGALRLVMAIQIFASIGSALIFSDNLWVPLALWRFLLGIGAGGVYPLAAVLSAEQGNTNDNEGNNNNQINSTQSEHPLEETHKEKMQKMRRVVLTFSMQGVGFIAVPVVTVPLLYILGEAHLTFIWRLVLALGSLPGLILVCMQGRLFNRHAGREPVPLTEPSDDSQSELSLEDNNRDVPFMQDSHIPVSENETTDIIEEVHNRTWWESIRAEPNLGRKLIGTAGTWFLFDVLFYGNTLFQPIVMEAAFGGSGSNNSDNTTDMQVLKKAATDSLALGAIALPGYAVSAFVIGKRTCHVTQTPRFVQLQGFVAMGLLYAIIGSYWDHLRRTPWLLILIYGLTFFFANYGPNTTTFTLPSLVYSHDVRSTLNGVSAAAGKSGALIGKFARASIYCSKFPFKIFFPISIRFVLNFPRHSSSPLGATFFSPAADSLGDADVMLLCAAVSVIAFVMTSLFVRIPTPNGATNTRTVTS